MSPLLEGKMLVSVTSYETRYSPFVSPNQFLYCSLNSSGRHCQFTINLFSLEAGEAMVSENEDMAMGWPLGLGFLNVRLRVAESVPAALVPPYSFHVPSTSFSSFSSSNLDTESTASSFQDKSVSLGRLIGVRAASNRGHGQLYLPTSLRFEERERTLAKASSSDDSKVQQKVDMFQGICIPVLLDALLKITRNKKNATN